MYEHARWRLDAARDVMPPSPLLADVGGWLGGAAALAMLTVTPDMTDATRSAGGVLGEYIFVVDRCVT